MSSSNTNEDKTKTKYTNRVAALAKYTAPNDQIPINGTPMAASAVSALYQGGLDTRKTLDDDRAATKIALQSRIAADGACKKVEKGFKAWVISKFGDGSKAAIDFGYAPKTPAQPKVTTKAQAQVKAEATRKARGTKGKKQAAAIKAPALPEATVATAPAGNGATTK